MVDITNAPRSILSSLAGEAFFSIGVTEGVTAIQRSAKIAVDTQQREINRIRGYKLEIPPADQKRLGKLQEKIVALNRKAIEGAIKPDEIKQRSEYYRQADKILGKPSVDVEADLKLKALTVKVNALLEPNLDPVKAKRLKLLRGMKVKLQDRLNDNPSNRSAIGQIRNVLKQIETLAPLRGVQDLSPAETKTYDGLVKEVNDYAKAKLLLDAKESVRVHELEKSIKQISPLVQAGAPAAPTAGQIASIYSRLA